MASKDKDNKQQPRDAKQAAALERYEQSMKQGRRDERESEQKGPYDDSTHVKD